MSFAGEIMDDILQIDRIGKWFGGLEALHAVELTVHTGEILALIGPNGSGKTTLLNLINGIYTPSGGEIRLRGERISGLTPHQITAKGIGRTFQTIRLFPEMPVRDNVMVGCHCRTRAGIFRVVFRTGAMRAEEREIEERALEELRFLGLAGEASNLARNLPYGDQRLLELARALATNPALLLLDEPAAGMNEAETKVLIEYIGKIRDRGISILLVEHDMNLVMTISDRIAVLNFGKKIAEGDKAAIQSNQAVIEAYLGKGIRYAQSRPGVGVL
jgi:branched-chain amino acid transport system ATP-binding protein